MEMNDSIANENKHTMPRILKNKDDDFSLLGGECGFSLDNLKSILEFYFRTIDFGFETSRH